MRVFSNSNGVEKYPLEFVILGTEQYYNQFATWELAKILVDAGTKLQYPEGLDILLQAWRYGNTELIDLLLPGFKKQKLLDYSNFENTQALRVVISDAISLGWIPDDEKNRDENMTARFNKLAEAGVKLPMSVVEDFIMNLTSYPKNPVPYELLLKMAGMKISDLDMIVSRQKINYVTVMETNFYKKPTGEYNDRIERVSPNTYVSENSIRHDYVFELLELGETFTDDEGEAQWLYVKKSGGTNGWIISRYFREEGKLNFVTTDNVNVRNEPYVTASLSDTLSEGALVVLWRIERIDTIDGITAPWFGVIYTVPEEVKRYYYNSDTLVVMDYGYIFSGYLREAEK